MAHDFLSGPAPCSTPASAARSAWELADGEKERQSRYKRRSRAEEIGELRVHCRFWAHNDLFLRELCGSRSENPCVRMQIRPNYQQEQVQSLL